MESVILTSDVRRDIDLIIEIAEKFGIKSIRSHSMSESYETGLNTDKIIVSDVPMNLKNNEFLGIWADRNDMNDSSKFVRNLRTKEFIK